MLELGGRAARGPKVAALWVLVQRLCVRVRVRVLVPVKVCVGAASAEMSKPRGGGEGGTKVKGFMSFFDKEQRGARIGSVLPRGSDGWKATRAGSRGQTGLVPNRTFDTKRGCCDIVTILTSRCAATVPSPLTLPL